MVQRSLHRSFVLRFVSCLIGFLTNHIVLRNWRNMQQFFGILDAFAKLGAPERNYMNRQGLAWRIVDFYLNNDSPYARQRRWDLGDQSSQPRFNTMWSLLSVLCRGCLTGARRGTRPPPTLLPDAIPVHVDALRLFLHNPTFLMKAIGCGQNEAAVASIWCHWIWEDTIADERFCDIFQQCVVATEFDAMGPLYSLLDAVLDLKDSLQLTRVGRYLNPKNGLMEKAFRFRAQYPLFTYGCAKRLLSVARRIGSVAALYLARNRRSLAWLEHWLPAHEAEQACALGDEADTETARLARQKSVHETLQDYVHWARQVEQYQEDDVQAATPEVKSVPPDDDGYISGEELL